MAHWEFKRDTADRVTSECNTADGMKVVKIVVEAGSASREVLLFFFLNPNVIALRGVCLGLRVKVVVGAAAATGEEAATANGAAAPGDAETDPEKKAKKVSCDPAVYGRGKLESMWPM